MSTSPINEDVIKVYQFASNASLKKGHTYVNTACLFDGVQRLFITNPKYKELSAKVKEILGRYCINSKNFNDAFDEMFPAGEALGVNVDTELDDDARNVIDVLRLRAQTERRVQDVDDFIVQLFSNKGYKLYFVFSRISDKLREDYDAAVDAGTAEEDLPPIAFDVNLLYADILKLLTKVTVKEVKSLESDEMKKYLTNVNKYVNEHKDFKLIGMTRELTALEVALSGRTKKSACLVGLPGVGKTSIVYELANKINNNAADLPESIKGCAIYELHLDSIVAGAQFRGQFEERLKKIIDAVAKLPNVILFIDEFHTVVKAGGSGSESAGDTTAANILKPYISRGEVRIIGATTIDEYNECVEKDKAISRRFKKVNVQEPTKEEVLEIMRGVLPIDIEFFEKDMREEALDRIYTLSTQYNIQTANPDRALTMLESAFAYCVVCEREKKAVTIDDMIHALELEFGVTMSETKAADCHKALNEYLLGQSKPLDEVCKYLDMIDMNICDPNKPRCSLFLAGPTGTGKTETAKIIDKYFTGSEKNLVVVEGNTLASETGITSLFGSDPGYVGYKQTSDFLAQVKQNPNCVVLFDEIEKAHPTVRQSLLTILDEGYAKDKGGNNISFRNAIIIFTSNIGFGTNNHSGSGIMSSMASSGSAKSEIDKEFSPEWLGRIDEVIYYNRLSNDIANKLIERYRKKYVELSGIDVEFTKDNLAKIRRDASIDSLGARNLEHVVKLAYAKKAYAIFEKQKESV